VAEPPAFELG
jgi:hypothetical protein